MAKKVTPLTAEQHAQRVEVALEEAYGQAVSTATYLSLRYGADSSVARSAMALTASMRADKAHLAALAAAVREIEEEAGK